MISVRRSTLRLWSIGIGLLFVAAVYYSMHYRLPWDWNAPGNGKLPQDIVGSFLHEAYDEGRGAAAVRDYFAPTAIDLAPDAADRRDGAPIAHQIRATVAQGLTVVVFHRIAPARGEPGLDAIDVFHTKDGRILRRERYPTSFVDGKGE